MAKKTSDVLFTPAVGVKVQPVQRSRDTHLNDVGVIVYILNRPYQPGQPSYFVQYEPDGSIYQYDNMTGFNLVQESNEELIQPSPLVHAMLQVFNEPVGLLAEYVIAEAHRQYPLVPRSRIVETFFSLLAMGEVCLTNTGYQANPNSKLLNSMELTDV